MGDLNAGSARSLILEGSEHGFATTRVDALLGWARKYSLFAYPFVTACCGMEFMAVTSPRFDVARFGAEAPRFSPRQSDLLWVVGTISQRQAPVLRRIYEQMMAPKWVFAFGTCASTGGFYDNYTTVPGIDKIIPTDIYIPGCPPRPEQVLDGLMLLQDKIARNERRPGVVKPRFDPADDVAGLVKLRRSAHDPRELVSALKERETKALAQGDSVSQLVLDKLKERFGASILETHSNFGDDTAVVEPRQWKGVCAFLRQDPALDFDLPVDLCGVDYPGRLPRMEVVLHLYSISKGHRVRLKARVGDEDMIGAELDSVTSIWPGLNWLEREVFDMSGVRFRGHPDLRRILMYPEFEGHPLQKTYPADKTQPLVPYRTEDEAGMPIHKLEPFGPDEGMPFGRHRQFRPEEN